MRYGRRGSGLCLLLWRPVDFRISMLYLRSGRGGSWTTHVEIEWIVRIPPHGLDVTLDTPPPHFLLGTPHIRHYNCAVITPT